MSDNKPTTEPQYRETAVIENPFGPDSQALPARLRRPRIPQMMRRPLAIAGILIIAFWVFAILAAPLLTTDNPTEPTGNIFLPPSADNIFGTDQLGQDVFSRTIYAARLSLPLAFLLVVIAVVIGGIIGAAAGYFGGWVDTVLMRVVDIVFAFPAIILAMVVTAVLGPGIANAVIALALVTWPTYARVVRVLVLSMTHSDFVLCARMLGSSPWRTIVKDVVPNVVGPVLGLGAQPPTPEWGAMISEGADNFQYWWVGTFPGLAILTVVVASNFLGDSLRDAIDPRSLSRAGGERA